jgi:chromosome segregation ATPase
MVEEDQKMIQRIIVDEIINAARSVEPELPRALAQNTNGGDSDEMYATLYNDILSRNNHLREAIKDPQNSIRELNVEIQEIGNNRPLPPADDVLERDKLVKDYESQVKEQKYRLDFLNKELHTFTSAMRIWESRINQVSSGLGPAMNRATRGRSHSHQLHITDTNSAIREIQVSIRQIETIEQREQDLRNRILKSTEDATRTLGDLERETKKHRDRIVELATQRASIKKDLEDSQIASQKLQQSLNEEKKTLDLLQKRREHQNALSDNVARQRSEFWSDKKRLEDESKRYLECTVERVVEERFNPDYQETFDFFRKRLQKSGLR